MPWTTARFDRWYISPVIHVALLIVSPSSASQSPGDVRLKPGFRLDAVYDVPESQGSWVSLTSDARGRLIASDEDGELYLIDPPPTDSQGAIAQVNPLPLELKSAQGLACVGNDLYVVVNSRNTNQTTGLHRAFDTDEDGIWDESELLRELGKAGEHGPHAVVAGADGRSLFIACGNDTKLTHFAASRMPSLGHDDVLLMRLIEPTPWHAVIRKHPAGWIARIDLDKNEWELFSGGYRNQYDLAVNHHGELFTYESDMEYDIGAPWYRPTHVRHVTSGLDAGWRGGAGKFPTYFADTLPPLVELGPGSPTGLEFGYGTSFPTKYQNALFAADWGRGLIHALHLVPDNASYTATAETFIAATPLPITDLAANRKDGALYFTTGGRGVRSTLWRVVFVGNRSGHPLPPSDHSRAGRARERRRRLERFHRPHPDAVASAWPKLDHEDRFIRYAARTAVEHQPVETWRPRALAEPLPGRRIAACLALTRMAPESDASAIVDAIMELEWKSLSPLERRDALRTLQVLLARNGALPERVALRVSAQLRELYPNEDLFSNRLIAALLAKVEPGAVPILLEQYDDAWDDEEQMFLALVLCEIPTGWTSSLRHTFGQHLVALLTRHRESSLRPYLDQIVERTLALAPESEQSALARLIATDEVNTSQEHSPRPVVQQWTLETALSAIETASAADAENGARLFVEAQCATCHRFGSRGGAVGPDLTSVASRYSLPDVVTAVVQPDETIPDQYRQTVFQVNGRILVGRIIDHREGHIRIATDMTDPKRSEYVPVSDIEMQTASDVSPMPRGMLDVLNAQEVADLFAYLRGRSQP